MNKINIVTGHKGLYSFDILLKAKAYTPKQIEEEYIRAKDELYDVKHKYKKIVNNKLVKLLIKFNLIKL